MKDIKKIIRLYPGGIINQNGNNMNVTMQGYGSVTPENVLQDWINKMSQKNINEFADKCDEEQKRREKEGHKKFEWKQPIFIKKFRKPLFFHRDIWQVDEGDWGGGSFKSFIELKDAINYAKTQRNIFVNIINKITNEVCKVRNMS